MNASPARRAQRAQSPAGNPPPAHQLQYTHLIYINVSIYPEDRHQNLTAIFYLLECARNFPPALHRYRESASFLRFSALHLLLYAKYFHLYPTQLFDESDEPTPRDTHPSSECVNVLAGDLAPAAIVLLHCRPVQGRGLSFKISSCCQAGLMGLPWEPVRGPIVASCACLPLDYTHQLLTPPIIYLHGIFICVLPTPSLLLVADTTATAATHIRLCVRLARTYAT